MYSFDNYYSDFPPQEADFLPNLHNSSSPCNLTYERLDLFHQHQKIYPPNHMGSFIPQESSNPRFTYSNFPYYPNAPFENTSLGQSSSSKRDLHTKISTSQGVRARRVRLSMEIARDFFDLQDMLGFDKASKTLEWLLAKSKGAIQELILRKCGSGSIRSDSSSYEEETIRRRRALARRGSPSCKSLGSDSYPQEGIEKALVENQFNSRVTRESRAKARARARERTRAKAKPYQFEDLGFEASAKGGFECNEPMQDLNRLNVINGQVSIGDQDDYPRVSHPLNLLSTSNDYDPDSIMYPSFFDLEHLHFS